jgi:hypothetical protein
MTLQQFRLFSAQPCQLIRADARNSRQLDATRNEPSLRARLLSAAPAALAASAADEKRRSLDTAASQRGAPNIAVLHVSYCDPYV